MTAGPLTRDDVRWADPATFDALAFGLTEPVRVMVPPDGNWRWQQRCAVCDLTRAEDSEWEAHQIQRRRKYAEKTGIPFDLWRCGRCGEPVGARAVQRDGLRYCDEVHAELDTVLVWRETVNDGPSEIQVGAAMYGRGGVR